MGKVTIPLMACAVLVAAASGQGPMASSTPPISPAEGTAAVRLARQAMLGYLRDRTPAEAVALPESAQSLAQRTNAAAVTLRSGGEQVAQSIRRGNDLARSIIGASLAAMRSPKLPDQVTPEYLEGLIVEVEILGPSEGLDAERLAEAVVPGLVGVTASRGVNDSTILPSDSYVRSLSAEEGPRECLAGLPLNAANVSLPVRWQAFASSHYVGYPDGKVLWLHQGRTPIPAEMIDAKDLSAAAGLAGGFLLRNQDKDGRFTLPEGPSDPADELYATMALARLVKATGRKDLSQGLEAALAHAVRRLRQEAA
jgi:AMMECR1 domain-containing protein